MVASNFDACLRPLLLHEGGNDDDPKDPGGRTSRGITQSEYDHWRTARGLARRDVWTADDAEVRRIYYDEYWLALGCDDLPAGVDYAVFDYGVNSGIHRSAWELQATVHAAQDASIGPKTVAAVKALGSVPAINGLCDERLAFLKGLRTWTRFGGGWTTRVADVRALSRQMAVAVVPVLPPSPVPPFPWPPDVALPPAPDRPPPPSPLPAGFLLRLRAALERLFS